MNKTQKHWIKMRIGNCVSKDNSQDYFKMFQGEAYGHKKYDAYTVLVGPKDAKHESYKTACQKGAGEVNIN